MKFKTILFCLFILGVCGCSDHVLLEKEVIYPAETRSGVQYSDDEHDLSEFAWWTHFCDPKLNQLIKDALARNNEIQSANAAIEEAKAQLRSAQMAWLPTLDATAQGFSAGTWNTSITPEGPLVNTPIFSNLSNLRFQGYYAGFVPSYTLNIMNNIYNIRASRASLDIKCAQREATNLTIISQMAGSYFMLISQRAQLHLEQDLIGDLIELHHLEHVRYKSGANDIQRVTELDQQIAEENQKIPQIEAVINQTENAIRVLVDENPGPICTAQTIFALKTEALVPKCLSSCVLRNRPDVMIGIHNVDMANAQVGISYAAFFPSIRLTTTVGRSAIEFVHLLKLSTAFWFAQASAAMKLINGSAYQNIKAAKAQYFSTYFNYLQTLRAAFADVDNNLTYEQKTRMAYGQAQRAYAAGKKTYILALRRYQAGAKDYRDVVNAKVTVDQLALTLIQEKAELLDSIVQVYTAIAAGSRASCEHPE